MIGNINHIAIVVPDLDAAVAHWRDMLGAEVSQAQTLPEHGVRIVFVRSANGQVELMEPFGIEVVIRKEKQQKCSFIEES